MEVDFGSSADEDQDTVYVAPVRNPLEQDGGTMLVGGVLIESVAEAPPKKPSHYTLPDHFEYVLEEVPREQRVRAF